MSLGWQVKWNNVLDHLTFVKSESKVKEYIAEIYTRPNATIVSFVNAHAMNTIVENEEFYNSIMASDTVFRDGSGLSYLISSLGCSPGINMNGTDLIPKLIKHCSGTIALLGTKEPFLSSANQFIRNELNSNLEIIVADGFSDDQTYIDIVKMNNPRLVVLGMGMPKQERVAIKIREQCTTPCVIVCGGAIIDFMGGKVSRAPVWMRKLGVEWLYRFFLEPRRLFKRYVVGNPLFIWRARKLRCQKDDFK